MAKSFKVFLWLAPLIFMWLVIVYGLYPLTHRDYAIDFGLMLNRFDGAFQKSLYTWFQTIKDGAISDFQNSVKAFDDTLSNWVGTAWYEQVLSYLKKFFNFLSFIVSGVGKILFWYPLTLLYYIFSFLVGIFDVVFNPSFVNVGQYYKEEWSIDFSELVFSFDYGSNRLALDSKLIVDNINL